MSTRMHSIVKDMLKSVYNLNEMGLSDMLEVAFEMYPVRVVCADIIAPMMWEIGSMWERGELMVVMEHFASNVIIAKLKAMLHKQNTTSNAKGPTVIVGCAPDEFHEIGALIVAFFMSINGWKVVYLGQNIPPTDVLNIIDTLDVHTIAMSSSTLASLNSLKVIGEHIATRSKRKKIEFLVGGRLLSLGENILESIPSATTRTADDLYVYCPSSHPTHSDTMVRGALDESYRKMRLANERRKRTKYLLDQITAEGTTLDFKGEEEADGIVAALSTVLQKAGIDVGNSCDAPERVATEAPLIEEVDDSGKPIRKEESPPSVSPSTTPSPTPPSSSPSPPRSSSPVLPSPSPIPASISSPPPQATPKPPSATPTPPVTSQRPRSTSPIASSTPLAPTASKTFKSVTPVGVSNINASRDKDKRDKDLADLLERQRQQHEALKEKIKKYQDGKKAAEDSIKRSRAFLNENRLVSAKPSLKPSLPAMPPPVEPPALPHSPATPYVPPTYVNRLVSQPAASPKPTTTTFTHMHTPSYRPSADENPKNYFPKYSNIPKVTDNSSSGSSNGSLSDDEVIEEGVT